MKVLHLIYDYYPEAGGYTHRSKALFDVELKIGNQPVVAVGPYFYKEPTQNPNFKVYNCSHKHFFPRKVLAYRPEVIYSLVKDITEICRKENVEVIHAHDPPLEGLAAMLAARKLKVKWIYHIRGLSEETMRLSHPLPLIIPRYLEYKAARRIVLNRCKNVITISEALKDHFSNEKNREKFHVLPNGVDVDKFRPGIDGSVVRKELGLEDKKIILHAGNIREIEGLDLMLKALPDILKDSKDVYFLILSNENNKYVTDFLDLASRLGVKDHVSIIPNVKHDSVPAYIAASDLYVLPRRKNIVCDLVTPLKPYEPMAMEKSVLASDLRAFREIIEPDVTGYLFEPDNPKDFADKVTQILGNEKGRTNVGKNARKWIIENRTWDAVGAKLKKIYEALQ